MATPTNPFANLLNPALDSALNTWLTATTNLWQSPAAYWQTVASIQTLRAQYLTQCAKQTATNLQALAACTSWPQMVAESTRQLGHLTLQTIALNNATQAHRSALQSQCQTLTQRALNTPHSTPNIPVTSTSKSSPIAPTITPTAIIPTPTNIATFTPPVTMPISNVTPLKPENTPAPQQNPQQATGTTGLPLYESTITPITTSTAAPILAPVISSTANSVMRSSAGSTIASAASARRSVVARRQSARRRPR